ncbi:MAG: type II toxin-antitoxin system VapC family toxin [Conexibacter sp.]
MPEIRPGAGLLDTSILVDPAGSSMLPSETWVSTLSLAELAAGPHATEDPAERARRQHHLQTIEATYDPLPFDTACARVYGTVFAAIVAQGRKARGRRAVDLLIAATAVANQLPLYTRNPRDLTGLDHLLEIVDASPS